MVRGGRAFSGASARSAPDRQSGFTLIELLVALAVFSIAALALINLQGNSIRTTLTLENRVIADVVAENRAVEALTDPMTPPFGEVQGSEAAAGRDWRWTRRVTRMPDPAIQKIDIRVLDDDAGVAAELTVFRRLA